MNQCDGCRAGRALVKLVDGEFVPAPDGTMHIMGKDGGYVDLMGCEQARYCACDQRGHHQACACCGMRQGEKCFKSNLHPKADLTPAPDSGKVSP